MADYEPCTLDSTGTCTVLGHQHAVPNTDAERIVAEIRELFAAKDTALRETADALLIVTDRMGEVSAILKEAGQVAVRLDVREQARAVVRQLADHSDEISRLHQAWLLQAETITKLRAEVDRLTRLRRDLEPAR